MIAFRDSDFAKSKLFIILPIAMIFHIVFTVFTYYKMSELASKWQEFNEKELEVYKHLRDVYEGLGYGGYIHYFKNIVLRGDTQLVVELAHSKSKILAGFEGIKEHWPQASVVNEVKQTEVVLAKYFDNEKYLVQRQQLTAEQIDKLVKVDDSTAISGLSSLRAEIDASVGLSREQLNQQIENFVYLFIAWLINSIFYLFIGYYAYRLAKNVRSKNQQIHAIVEKSPEAIIVVNEDGQIVLSNDKAHQIFKVDENNFNGTFVEDWMPKNLRARHQFLRKTFIE